jgi:hypothetical protein
MKRREFVETLLVLPVGVFLVHCSSSNNSYGTGSSPGSDAPAAPPQVNGTQAVYASSEVDAHHHTFGIDMSAFTKPPEAGVSGDTSSEAAHTHTVSVSVSDLESVESGGTVKVTTSSSVGHTHVFTFVKVSA